jgi:anti-anti-sigma factor
LKTLPLTITSRVDDDFGILELSGNLTLGPSLVGLRNNARQLLDAQKLSGLIVNVAGVTQTDSSGLGELTVVYTWANKRNCPIRLVNVRPELRRMLELTRLDGILPSASDVTAAKNEMRRSRGSSATA